MNEHALYNQLFEGVKNKSTRQIDRNLLVDRINLLPGLLKDKKQIRAANEMIQSLILKFYRDNNKGQTATPYGAEILKNGSIRYKYEALPPRLVLIINEFIESISQG